jgi:hypothetical protein
MSKGIKVLLWVSFFVVSFYLLIVFDRLYINSKVPVSLPGTNYFLDMWEQGYVVVDGKISENKGDYYDKFNVIKVTCDFSKKNCTHSIGGLLGPIKNYEFPPLLYVRTEDYFVTNWSKEILIYKDKGSCYETTFTLVRNTKTLTGVRKYSKNLPTCQRDDEITYTIVNGFDFVMKEQKEVQNLFLNILLFLVISFVTILGIYKSLRGKTNEN